MSERRQPFWHSTLDPPHSTYLRLERAAAAARLHGIGVIELEAAGFEAFVEVDGRAVQVEGALLVDDDWHAVIFVLRIGLFVERFVEAECIGEPAAAAARDADAEDHFRLDLLIDDDPLNFVGRFFGEDDAHGGEFSTNVFWSNFEARRRGLPGYASGYRFRQL